MAPNSIERKQHVQNVQQRLLLGNAQAKNLIDAVHTFHESLKSATMMREHMEDEIIPETFVNIIKKASANLNTLKKDLRISGKEIMKLYREERQLDEVIDDTLEIDHLEKLEISMVFKISELNEALNITDENSEIDPNKLSTLPADAQKICVYLNDQFHIDFDRLRLLSQKLNLMLHNSNSPYTFRKFLLDASNMRGYHEFHLFEKFDEHELDMPGAIENRTKLTQFLNNLSTNAFKDMKLSYIEGSVIKDLIHDLHDISEVTVLIQNAIMLCCVYLYENYEPEKVTRILQNMSQEIETGLENVRTSMPI